MLFFLGEVQKDGTDAERMAEIVPRAGPTIRHMEITSSGRWEWVGAAVSGCSLAVPPESPEVPLGEQIQQAHPNGYCEIRMLNLMGYWLNSAGLLCS